MGTRVDRSIHGANLSGFIDKVTDPLGVAGLGVVTRAVGEPDRACGVAQKGKRKVELLGKSRICGDRIETDAEHYDVVGLKIGDLVAEPATLGGSAWGIGFGIEPQQHLFPAQVCQGTLLPFVCLHRKLRSCISHL